MVAALYTLFETPDAGGNIGTLHVFTESKAGFPIHWSKPWPGGVWVAENCNTPAPGGTEEAGPGLYDAFGGPGQQFSVHQD